jgi:hypothetical protein
MTSWSTPAFVLAHVSGPDGVRVPLPETTNLDDTNVVPSSFAYSLNASKRGFALLNELNQPGHPLALGLEPSFLEPVRGNEYERS